MLTALTGVAMEFYTLDIRQLKFKIHPMALPYKVATLLYCFNERDEVLLLERAQEPNRGFWSPCGGKLKMDIGESPYVCGCREAQEEIRDTVRGAQDEATWQRIQGDEYGGF